MRNYRTIGNNNSNMLKSTSAKSINELKLRLVHANGDKLEVGFQSKVYGRNAAALFREYIGGLRRSLSSSSSYYFALTDVDGVTRNVSGWDVYSSGTISIGNTTKEYDYYINKADSTLLERQSILQQTVPATPLGDNYMVYKFGLDYFSSTLLEINEICVYMYITLNPAISPNSGYKFLYQRFLLDNTYIFGFGNYINFEIENYTGVGGTI